MKKTLKQNDFFKTSDLALATAISLFYPIETIDRTVNPNRVNFLFKRDGSLDSLVEQYWRQELKVEPQAYFNQLKIIKSRLYANK